MIAQLDYKTPINMRADSRLERELRLHSCAKEPETVEWIESLPPGVFYDLGANVGAYSFVAAANGHTVHAFEPAPFNASALDFNRQANPDLEVTLHRVLLGDENCTTSLKYSSEEPGAACHELGVEGDVDLMEMRTLDLYISAMNLPFPDYIKLDVDGSELRVLKGAYVTLSRGLGSVRSVLMETDDDLPDPTAAERFLLSRGFEVTSRHRHKNGPISNVRYDR